MAKDSIYYSNIALVLHNDRTIFNEAVQSTDLYGKPYTVFLHNGGVEQIAREVKQILDKDFREYLNLGLYKRLLPDELTAQPEMILSPKPTPVQPAIDLVQEATNKIQHPVTPPTPQPLSNRPQATKTPQMYLPTVAEGQQLSLFDSFGEASQATIATPPPQLKKKPAIAKKRTRKPPAIPRTNGQPVVNSDLFSSIGMNSNGKTGNLQNNTPVLPEPKPYSSEWQPFYREDCLVWDNGFVGYLREVYPSNSTAVFHPLRLSPLQQARAEAYIALRDVYQSLYNKEAEFQTEHRQERETLNSLYDTFTKSYGHLNSADNIKLIKTDSAGKEVPYLERVVGGVVHKADIFHRPVSFSTATPATDNPDEALVASLNTYGTVDLDYMAGISDMSKESLKDALHGRIFYNPLEKEYEISEKWVSGNVITKAEAIREYLTQQPDDKE